MSNEPNRLKPRQGILTRLGLHRNRYHGSAPARDESHEPHALDSAAPLDLLPHHRALIDASGISEDVARARGYRSVEDPNELKELGFADYQCIVPGLLVPIHDALGRVPTYQLRPDKPRTKDEKPLKYETPQGAKMVVDVAPSVRRVLGDPSVPLIITEGARKADAAVSRDLACIDLLGVHNFRGTDEHGAKRRLPCWQEIALNGRPVSICYDSDVMEKPAVHAALVELKLFLEHRDAQVKIIYLPNDNGRKQGLDDYLAAGHTADDLLALGTDELRPLLPNEGVVGAFTEPPVPLTTYDRPTFPVGAFPDWLEEFVSETARAVQVPIDIIAMLALGVLATACARKVRVLVRPGFSVPLNLYLMAALPPGERKSSAVEAVMAPLAQFERDETERLKPLIIEATNRKVILEQAHRDAQNAAAKDDTDRDAKIQAAIAIDTQLSELIVPVPLRLGVDDCTPERLTTMLAEQGGRIAVHSAEGGELFAIAGGRYSKGANFGVLLKGHSGDTIKVDRAGRPPEHIEHPAITVAVTVQPGVIQGLTQRQDFSDRGLLGRFLYAVPHSLLGRRDVTPSPVSSSVVAAYQRSVMDLLGVGYGTNGRGEPAAQTIRLSDAAAARLSQFARELEPRLGPYGDLGQMSDWAAKLEGATVRIAGLLHMAQYYGSDPRRWQVPIRDETVERAITIAHYLIAHAKIAYAEMGANPDVADAQYILGRIERDDLQQFSKRDLHQSLKSRFKKVDDIEPGLRILESHEFIRPRGTVSAPETRRKGGRPPSTVYDVNPLWKPSQPSLPTSGGGSEGFEGSENDTASASADATIHGDDNDDIVEIPASGDIQASTAVDGGEPACGFDLGKLTVITDPTEFAAIEQQLLDADVIGFDIETTGLNPRTGSIRLIQLAAPGLTVVIDCHSCDPMILTRIFQQGRCFAGHNIKFELTFLAAADLPVPGGARLFDTMIACQLLDAGKKVLPRGHFSLAGVAERYLGITLDKTEQASDWSGTLTDAQLRYAATDAAVVLSLVERLEDELQRARLTRVMAIEMQALPAIAAVQEAGVPINAAAWTTIADEAIEKRNEIERELNTLAGQSINWNSTPQIKRLLGSRGHDVEKTDSATLRALAATDPIAGLIVQYRETGKQVSTYGHKFLQAVDPMTGRLHGEFVQVGADTGRMASRNPNLQNIPKHGGYREAIHAGEGRSLIIADYSQIELRIIAQITQDPAMLDAFRNGEDLHLLTAKAVLGREPSRADRQIAKALNFGLMFGMGVPRLRASAKDDYGVDMTDAEARQFQDAFFAAYPKVRYWHSSQPNITVETRTLTDRRRLDVGSFNEKVNSPVQGTGADLVKLALARLFEDRQTMPSATVILVVHDEIVVEMDTADAQATADWVRQHMIGAAAEILQDVPVEVGITIAKHWGEKG